MKTKKSLGQNFLFDTAILSSIVGAAGLTPDDTVVEIGPGPGIMTRLLAESVRKVVAVELDEDLFKRLKAEFAGYRNVEILHADALTYPYDQLDPFRVVANIPYYITTPIIFRLLDVPQLKSATLTIQKEVAERIVAGPGGRDYGVLSIMVQYRSVPEFRFIIPAEAFKPVPKVDSAVIHLTVREHRAVTVADEKFFFRVIRTAFSQRRKTLANSLRGMDADIRQVLTNAGIDPSRRPETLSIVEFGRLADMLRGSATV